MTVRRILLRYIYYGLRRLALERRIVPDDHSLIDHFKEWLDSLPKTYASAFPLALTVSDAKQAYNNEPEVGDGEHGCAFRQELRNRDREVLEEVRVAVPHRLGGVWAGEERRADVAGGVNAVAGPRRSEPHAGLDADGDRNILGPCEGRLGEHQPGK